jgi:rhodanese-related sulfurtransferase
VSESSVEWLDAPEVRERLEAGTLLVIDLRGPPDYAGGRIPGSVSLPGRAIESRWNKVPTGRTLLFVDDDGTRVETVCALARAQGHADVAGLRGGFEAWFDAGYPVETMSDGLPPLEDA